MRIYILKNCRIFANSLKVYISQLINLNYMELKDLVFIIIAIFIAVLLLKIFMWLLPVFVVLVIAFVIYIFFKSNYSK